MWIGLYLTRKGKREGMLSMLRLWVLKLSAKTHLHTHSGDRYAALLACVIYSFDFISNTLVFYVLMRHMDDEMDD